jgi:hypothetical protein
MTYRAGRRQFSLFVPYFAARVVSAALIAIGQNVDWRLITLARSRKIIVVTTVLAIAIFAVGELFFGGFTVTVCRLAATSALSFKGLREISDSITMTAHHYPSRLLAMLKSENPDTEMAVLAEPGRELDGHLRSFASGERKSNRIS